MPIAGMGLSLPCLSATSGTGEVVEDMCRLDAAEHLSRAVAVQEVVRRRGLPVTI
jgi:hypothetical protein